jgi:hypothetical protein
MDLWVGPTRRAAWAGAIVEDGIVEPMLASDSAVELPLAQGGGRGIRRYRYHCGTAVTIAGDRFERCQHR